MMSDPRCLIRTVAALACTLVAMPARVFALGGPSPGAVTAQTVKLPAGPGSVRGLADDATVSGFTGQVQYAVPIELPAAPGGLAPSLSLGYDGDLGNGPLGVGWSLSQPGIRRSLRLGVPAYTATDELDVTGLASGQLVALPDGTFRIEAQGNAYAGRALSGGFELTGPDGKIYRFGTTDAARKASAGRTAAWYLELVRDVAGQSIAYHYAHDRGEVYLDRIAWGPSVAGAPAFAAELLYEARPDAVVSYRTGFRVEAARRLTQIKIWSFGAVRRVVSLGYDASFALSRLATVQLTSGDGVDAMPALAFRYAAAAPGAAVPVPELGGWALNLQGTSLFDVDGDGAMDLLRLQASGHSYRRNLGGRFDTPRSLAGAAGASLDQARLLDLTGDASAELVRQQGSQWSVFQLTGPDADHRTWTALGSWSGAQNLSLASATVTDLNGDALMDVVSVSGSSLQVRLATSTGLAAPVLRPAIDTTRSFITPGNAATSFPDLNGDGLADAVYVGTSAFFLYLGKGDGSFERYRDLPFPWTGSVPTSQIRLGDLNRDGLLDVAVVRAGNVEWYRGLANAALDPAPVRIARPAGTDASVVVALADANGNGSEDVVWSSDAGMWILDLAGPTSAGMLTAIDNGLGQTQAFGYDASAHLAFAAASAGVPWSTSMPVSIPVSTSTRTSFASGEPTRSTRLDVRDGLYDRAERRFLGFAQSTLTRPDPADGAPSDQIIRRVQDFAPGLGLDRVLRGRVVHERIETAEGALLREVVTDLVALTIDGLPGGDPRLHRAGVVEERVRRAEAARTPVEIRTRYAHDGEGRVIEEAQDGRIDLTGDETIRRRTYTSRDPETGVRDLVCEEEVVGPDGVSAGKSRRWFGDDARIGGLCEPGRGWVREEQGYLAEEARWVTRKRTRFDAVGNTIEHTEAGVTRTLGYDDHQLFVTSETVAPAPDRVLVWQMSWDPRLGVARRLTGPDGAVQTAGYDGLGRLTSIADGEGPPHTYYRYAWSAPRPRTEHFVFDGEPAALGALPAIWTPGSGWRHDIDLATSAGEPWRTAVQLDTARWIIRDDRTHDALGRTTAIANAFYVDGDPTTARPLDVAVQTVRYDALDRAVRQTQAAGTIKQTVFTPLGTITTTDGLAAVRTETDGLGRTIRTERTVDGVTESVDTSYDPAGRVVRLRLQAGTAAQVDHSFRYDALGRLVFAHDPDLGDRTMVYDDAGALIRSTNGAGEVIEYTYDGAGRLATVTAGEAPIRFHYDLPRSAGYDHTASRLAWVEEPTGTVDLGYDAHGRRIAFHREIVDGDTRIAATQRTVLSPSGLVHATTFDDGHALTTRHDPAGRAVAVADGAALVWALDDQTAAGDVLRERFGNGVTQITERDVPERARRIRVARGDRALYDVALGYTPYAAIDTLDDRDGSGLDHTARFTYDAGGRLTTAALGAPGPAQYQFAFGYDGLQNMIRRDVAGPTAIGVLAGSYRYAGAGPRQLTDVVDATGAAIARFTYDTAGRQIRHADQALHYNALSQLVRVDLPSGSVTHRYGHDGERVITRDSAGTASYWLTSDLVETGGARDHYVRVGSRIIARLTRTATPPTTSADVAGVLRRGAALVVVVLLVGCAIPRRRSARAVRRAYLALAALALPGCTGGTGRTAAALDGQVVRALYFHAGAGPGPALVTDAVGAVYEERRYEPFGQPIDAYRDDGGVVAADYRRQPINGLNKPSDPDTGLSFHGARWLPSDTAQWLTPDPPVKAPEPRFAQEPWSLHPYQYVLQNPIVYWDPDGREPFFVDDEVILRRPLPLSTIGTDTTFSDAAVSRMAQFFVANVSHPNASGGQEGNTDPRYRFSCIATMNRGVNALYDHAFWSGNGPSEADMSQNDLLARGRILGESRVRYAWNRTTATATATASDWAAIVDLSNGDTGQSVFLVSIAGGFHSATVTFDNRDPAHPTMSFSDQNWTSRGWKTFNNPTSFDAFMTWWQTTAGSAYADPARLPRPLDPPPIGARYVRLRPGGE